MRLKWARLLRRSLAVDIRKLEFGVQKVTEMTADGLVDVTSSVLAAKKDAFEHLEELIAEFSSDARGTGNASLDAKQEVKHTLRDAVAPAPAPTRTLGRQGS
jgi:hypothetical protein